MPDRPRLQRAAGTLLPDLIQPVRSKPTTGVCRHARSWLAASLLAVLAACSGGDGGSDDQPPPRYEEPVEVLPTPVGEPLGESVTQTIGPAGGAIESADGRLRIEVPAGAFAAEQVLSIQPIANHAHGRIGNAYRLAPEGLAFARPLKLRFQYTPEQIAGTAPQLLRVASQNADGIWELHEDLQLDTDTRTAWVEVNHFSDWSLVTGALLSPGSVTLRTGEWQEFSVVFCERVLGDDGLTPLVAQCRSSEVIRNLVRNWSVNGVPGGNGTVGTIALMGDRKALYTAPPAAPQPPVVAVSGQYTTPQGEQITLVADVRVQAGLCTPNGIAGSCSFDLVQVDGKALPYEDLPRDPWENPEVITGGRLTLMDFDGDGVGSWTLRHVWVEKRPVGDLEQFVQYAGDFTSGANGQLDFTVIGGGSFTGRIEQSTVTVNSYPLATSNGEVAVQLKFRAD